MEPAIVAACAAVVALLVIGLLAFYRLRVHGWDTAFKFEAASPYVVPSDPAAEKQTPSWPVQRDASSQMLKDARALRFKDAVFTVEDLDSGEKWTRDVSGILDGMALALDARAASLGLFLDAPLNPFSFAIKGFNTDPGDGQRPLAASLKNSRTTLTGLYKYV
jgi:hypothetical protein